MSSSNTWTDADSDTIIIKIALLEEMENKYRKKLDDVIFTMKGLDKINQNNPLDIDGTVIADTKRKELKNTLIAKSVILLANNI